MKTHNSQAAEDFMFTRFCLQSRKEGPLNALKLNSWQRSQCNPDQLCISNADPNSLYMTIDEISWKKNQIKIGCLLLIIWCWIHKRLMKNRRLFLFHSFLILAQQSWPLSNTCMSCGKNCSCNIKDMRVFYMHIFNM